MHIRHEPPASAQMVLGYIEIAVVILFVTWVYYSVYVLHAGEPLNLP